MCNVSDKSIWKEKCPFRHVWYLEADRISCVTFFYTSSSRDMGVENSVAGDDYEGNMANNGEANDDGVVLGVKQMTVWMLKRIG